MWEKMTVDAVSRLEALGRHLRRKLLGYPLSVSRRRQLEKLNFQQPSTADRLSKGVVWNWTFGMAWNRD